MYNEVFQDIRYGLRVLRKNKGFSLAAILTLALGIGANAAIFSLVYGVLIRPLPYQNGSSLVVLHQQEPKANQADIFFSAQDFFDYRDHNHTLSGVVEHHSMNFLLLSKDSAERVNTAVVSPNFFDVLGVKPLLGRTFVAADDMPTSNAVLILSYSYWMGRHGGDPNIVGKVFQMNNRPHTVIGVLPPIPQYPVENDVYMPTSQCPTRSSQRFIGNRQARMMTAFGRLKPGVRLEQAQADLSTLGTQLQREHPEAYPAAAGYTLAVAPLRDDLTRQARTTFLVLLGAAGFVLLIACANVANLLLARLLKLDRELAIRTALGASKTRLVRQVLTESVLVSLAGGAIGCALAPAALSLLVKFAERFTTRAAEIRVDGPVLLFTAAISLATGLLFGMAPAFSSGSGVADALRQGNGRTTTSRSGRHLRGLLVVSQVAVSFVLLIGAGLMIRSFLRLQQVNPGIQIDHVLTLRLSPNFTRYTAQTIPILRDTVLRRMRALPGISSAALASNYPFSPNGVAFGPGNRTFEIEGHPVARGELAPQADPTFITDGYFATLRQSIIVGRDFTEHDEMPNAPLVAIINQTMAHHRWLNEDPIGKRVSFDQGQHWTEIVGVVGDAKEYGLDRAVQDEIYTPANFAGALVVRTAADPDTLINAVRQELRDIDPQLAVDRVSTLQRLQQDSMAPPRVTTILLGLFALLALIISASGIAAVMALNVTQRTGELGIRMALGASRAEVLVMVVRQGLLLAVVGTAAGIAGAMAVTRLLSGLLYGTSPTDFSTFAGVAVVFLSVAAAACLIPARAVTAIDPVIALRQE